MPTFQIVTTDDQTRTQGDTEAFTALGHETATLESYEHEGDYVVLRYSQGLELAIHERHVRYIATVAE